MPSFPLDAAEIVGLFMSSVFYGCVILPVLSDLPDLVLTSLAGIHLVSFFSCMRILLWSEGAMKPLRLVNMKMVIASLTMFIIASLDLTLHVRHNLEAFIWYNGPAIENFSNISSWMNVLKVGTYVAQQFVGDSILILRCWIVYNRSWSVVILPILLWLGTTVTGVMALPIQASGQHLSSMRLVPFVTSSLGLSLATNVITTSLIVYRIWRVNNEIGRGQLFRPNSPLTRVVIVLIESGLLYTASVVILFVLYLAGNNAIYGVSNAIIQIIGITFNLIISSLNRKESVIGTTLPLGSNPSQQGAAVHRIKIDRHVATSKHIDVDSDIELRTTSGIKESWQQDSLTTSSRPYS